MLLPILNLIAMKKFMKYFRVTFSYLLLLLPILFGCEQKEDPADPIACFDMSSNEVEEDEMIAFSNCSTNAENYSWDFGDGDTSTEVSPTHSYGDFGQYAVKLRAYNKGKYHEETKVVKVVEAGGGTTTLVACFTYNPQSVEVNQAVEFTNCSDGEDSNSYQWDFGDGSTSTIEDPFHTYSEPGDYTVTLKVAAGSDTDQTQKSIHVTDVNSNTTSVTFFVQMYIQYLWGDFNPDYDKVEIIGDFNNWGSGTQFTMFRINDTSFIYGITLNNFELNKNIQFRFKANTSEGSHEEVDENGSLITRQHMVSSNPDENSLAYWFEDEDMVWVDEYDYEGVPVNSFSNHFFDDFTDPSSSSFYQGSGEDYSATISGGLYSVSNSSTSFGRQFTVGNFDGPEESLNYQYEYYMKIADYTDYYGAGLIWGVNNSDSPWSYYKFDISPAGGIRMGYYNSAWVTLLDWTSGNANPSPSYNLVTVRKLDSKYYIFINKTFAHEQIADPLFGSSFGVSVGSTLSVDFDYYGIDIINLNFGSKGMATPNKDIALPATPNNKKASTMQVFNKK